MSQDYIPSEYNLGMDKFRTLLIIIFLVILNIFAISLVWMGSAHLNDRGLPLDMIHTTCNLTTHEYIGCPDSTWVKVWNGRIVADVFSKYASIQMADVSNYNDNSSYPCMCHPDVATFGCNMWNVCYLNMNATEYVRYSSFILHSLSNAAIAIGALMIGGVIMFGIFVWKRKRATDNYVSANHIDLERS